MSEVLDELVDPKVLEVEHLRVRYANGALGVLDVSLVVKQAQLVVLMGANGAGKTTVARAVSGFLPGEGARVIGGTIRFEGRDIVGRAPHELSRIGIACVPERRKVFPKLTVRENLMFLGDRLNKPIRQAREARVFSLFPFLADRRSTTAGLLSGGEQQMLALGRALMGEPKLLVVDEMTLGLHPSLHAPLFEALHGIQAVGTSILLIDESVNFALSAAEYCYLLRSGQLHDQGAPDRFADSELVVAGYLGDES